VHTRPRVYTRGLQTIATSRPLWLLCVLRDQ
jgi:hypothetical protein